MEFLSLQYFLFLLFLSIYLYLHFFASPKKYKATGFAVYPIVGTLPSFLKNRHRFLDWTTEILTTCPTNTAVFRRPGKIGGIITANPSNVEHMLKTNFDNYPKGDRFISLIEDFLGHGIFNADGELWKVQRKTASYAFNTKSLRNFVMENVKTEIQSRLIPCLAKAAETGCRLDLQDVLERFAFDNVCKLAFNVDPVCLGDGDGETASGSDEFMKAFDDASTLIWGRFLYAFAFVYKIKRFFNVGSERRLKESIATVHNFADNIIRSRMEVEELGDHQDLLSRFIGITEDNNLPERWLKDDDGTCQLESAFRFPIFHAGPRMCLGKDLAYIQMKSIAASVMERFEIDVPNKDTCPEHLLSLTLRIKGGLPVRVRSRNAF